MRFAPHLSSTDFMMLDGAGTDPVYFNQSANALVRKAE